MGSRRKPIERGSASRTLAHTSASFRLLVGVVPLSGLHHDILRLGRDLNFVIARLRRSSSIGRVAKAVLIAQLFLDLRVDLIDGFLLGNLEQSPSRLF